jgi:hypothetical protein
MGDVLIMGEKERQRNVVMDQVSQGKMDLWEASETLKISYRQSKRVWKRYCEEGVVGLIHRSRGCVSGHAYPESFKAQVLDLYEARYRGFGPTLAAEVLLEEDGITVHPETLRLWLKAVGFWTGYRLKRSYRKRRVRRERFGELVQIDGSDHAWFGEEYARSCLLNMVDDATGTTLSRFDTGETTQVLLETLKRWIERYGIPLAVYVDLKSLYISPKRLSSVTEGQLAEDTWSVFEKVCKKLGIQIIRAYSPQAKGRVERNHGVYQDRLVKMLALKGIRTIAGANAYLEGGFITKLNQKFAVAPASKEDAHRKAAPYGDLDNMLCWEYTRQVKGDWTVQFKNQHYQLIKSGGQVIRPKQIIFVRRHLDGCISLWKDGEKVAYEVLAKAPEKAVVVKQLKGYSSVVCSHNARKNKGKTPWRHGLWPAKKMPTSG